MNKISLFAVIALITTGCIDEIDLNIDTDEQFVVVDGLISNELDTQVVKLNLSPIIGNGNDNILEPISGATVYVHEQAGASILFIEDPINPGDYKSFMAGNIGKSYHLEIQLPDGKIIKSIPETIENPVSIDSIYSETVPNEFINISGNKETVDYVELFMNTTYDPTDKPYLRWRVEGVYEFTEKYPMNFNPRKCYVTEKVDLNNIRIYNGHEYSENGVNDQLLVRTQVNIRFHSLYAFTITQQRISKREYNFWNQADQLINIDGTLFDLPPGTIKSNLYNTNDPNEVIAGYFSVVAKTRKRAFVSPFDIGYQFKTICTTIPRRPNPDQCANCLVLFNSTLEKPDYWPY